MNRGIKGQLLACVYHLSIVEIKVADVLQGLGKA